MQQRSQARDTASASVRQCFSASVFSVFLCVSVFSVFSVLCFSVFVFQCFVCQCVSVYSLSLL